MVFTTTIPPVYAAGATPTPSGPPPVATLPHLPLFTPDPAAAGLHLLAAAAANEHAATGPLRAPPSGTSLPLAPHTLLGLPPAPPTLASSPAALALLTKPGPFNPAASLPAKVAKRILDLEFVEMAEVTVDDDLQGSGRQPAPARLPVTDISQWLERFSLMAAILTTRFPEKAGELFAYQATIVRAERNYEGKRWVSYDRQFRREALARRDLNWSVTDPRLYNEAFTGRARAIARCSYCLQDDHTAPRCPKNPNRPVFGWFPDPSGWPAQAGGPPPPSPHYGQRPSPDICRRYNDGRCKQARCKYRHACHDCQGPHAWVDCPRNRARPGGRSRSPLGPPPRNPAGSSGQAQLGPRY